MSAAVPPLKYVLTDGSERREGVIPHSPFTIGRLAENDMVLAHPYVSRRHAEIFEENGEWYLVDCGSRHGTFVNGVPVAPRHRLRERDAVQFGALDGPAFHIGSHAHTSGSTIRDIISHIPAAGSDGTGLDKLRWFFESARKLKTFGAVDEILDALLEMTLKLTQTERGYVFLMNEAGELKLAQGRDSRGGLLTTEESVSHGAIHQALTTSSEYIVTDTLSTNPEIRSASIVAQNIRNILCIPLRKRRPGGGGRDSELLGLLYLDSRLKPGTLTQIDSDLLRTIATDAAALIDNAQLAFAEERERRYREELGIAAEIQRGLMCARLPELPWAKVSACSIPCREVGGDFFDILEDGESISLVVADISGKGISAAILASTLQGLIYSQLAAQQPLATIAAVVNRYVCGKNVGKYATLVILRLKTNGVLEYINCGHIPPFLYNGECLRLKDSNLPVGLLEEATFHAGSMHLTPGDRVLVVTDGVTESEDAEGTFFGEERLACPEIADASLDTICTHLQNFCGSLAAGDDCTLLDIRYVGQE